MRPTSRSLLAAFHWPLAAFRSPLAAFHWLLAAFRSLLAARRSPAKPAEGVA
jgi:hypothetical protein